jgi:hypothetical protein
MAGTLWRARGEFKLLACAVVPVVSGAKILAFRDDLWIIILCFGKAEAVLFDMVKKSLAADLVGRRNRRRKKISPFGRLIQSSI